MHENIAQITRTWVAIQLATGLTTHRGMEVVFATHTTNNTGGFHRAISNPTEIIKWNNQTESFTGSGQLPTQHSTDSLTTQTPVIDDTMHSQSIPTDLTPKKKSIQQSITSWIPLCETHSPDLSLIHMSQPTANESPSEYAQYGTKISNINTSKTL